METLEPLLDKAVRWFEANPRAGIAVAVVAGLLLLLLLRSLFGKGKRKGQVRAFFCERNRQAIADAAHSYFLRHKKCLDPLDVQALVREGLLDAKSARCKQGGRYSASYRPAPSSKVPIVSVTCSKHGTTQHGE